MHSQNLFCCNVDFENKRIINYTGFLGIYIKEYIIKNTKNPVFIYTGTNKIDKLTDPKFLSLKFKNKLRKKQISFFLYEPSCYYKIGEKHNRGWYSEFDKNCDFKNIRADELDSIEKFAIENNFYINVYTTDYNIEKIQSNYKNLKFFCYDIFIRHVDVNFGHMTDQSLHNWTRIVNEQFNSGKFISRFCCSNSRYTPHRNLMAAFLSNFDCVLSWHFECDLSIYKNLNWINYQKLIDKIEIQKGFDNLNNNLYFIDNPVSKIKIFSIDSTSHSNEIISSYNGTNFVNSYLGSMFIIVAETRFAQPFANISEKTLFSMLFLKPFILVAPPYSLKYIKELGFKTFNNWWDESYDNEEDHENRLYMIFDLIKTLDKIDITSYRNLILDMKETLEHNRSHLKHFKKDINSLF